MNEISALDQQQGSFLISGNEPLSSTFERSKTPDRITYEAEVDLIKSQWGDLEDIRFRLGLSGRKMAQLLMVDPSAWSRWTKKMTPAPPHIFRALQWYLILQEKNPGFNPQIFLSHRWHSQKLDQTQKTQNLEQEINLLKLQIHSLETQLNQQGAQRSSVDNSLKLNFLSHFLQKKSFFKAKLLFCILFLLILGFFAGRTLPF